MVSISVTMFVMTSVTLSLFVYWRRKFLKGNFFGLLDIYLVKKLKKQMKKKQYSEGWGEKSRFHIIEKFVSNIPKVPAKIDVKLVSESVIKPQKCSFNLSWKIYKFKSPEADLLREGEEHCHFGVLSAVDSKNRNGKVIINPPAAGDMGLSNRNKMFGNYFAAKGYTYVSPIPAIYKYRRAKKQENFGIAAFSFIDGISVGHAFLEELRSLVDYFASFEETKHICLFGMSYGGIMVSKTSQFPLLSQKNIEKGVKISFVPTIAKMSFFDERNIEGWIDDDVFDNNECIYPDEKYKNLPTWKVMRKLAEEKLEISNENMEILFNKSDFSYIHKIIAIHATNDLLVVKNERNMMIEFLNKNIKRSDPKKSVKNLYYPSGHFMMFKLKEANVFLKKVVEKSFEF